MDRMLARAFCGRYSWNACWLSFKEQDSRWPVEYACFRNILHLWRIYTLPGTESDKRRRLSAPGMAGADRCDSCFCRFMCLSFPKKRAESEIKIIWMQSIWDESQNKWVERLPFIGASSFPLYRRYQKSQVFNLTKSWYNECKRANMLAWLANGELDHDITKLCLDEKYGDSLWV